MKPLPTSHPLVKSVLRQMKAALTEHDTRIIAELVTATLPFNRCEQSGPSTDVNVDWINPAVGVDPFNIQDPGPGPGPDIAIKTMAENYKPPYLPGDLFVRGASSLGARDKGPGIGPGDAPPPVADDLRLANEQTKYYYTAWMRQQDTIRDLQRSNMEFVKRCESYSERLVHADKALAVANERVSLFDAKFTEANNKMVYYQEALAEQERRHATFLEALTNVIEGRFRVESKGQAAKAATDPRRS